MPFLIIRQDITKVNTDAIVNTANVYLKQGSGTSRAIYLAAGEEKLTRACEKIGYCDFGKAVITEGFDLAAKYIIHTVGPAWIDGKSGECEVLYSAYKESLMLAKKYELESVAFPLISAGNCGVPKKEALKIATAAISEFLLENDMTVYLTVYDKETVNISKKLFSDISEYIDDHYVKIQEWGFPEITESSLNEKERRVRLASFYRRQTKESEIGVDTIILSDLDDTKPIPDNIKADDRLKQSNSILSPKTSSLDELMRNKEETFSQMLLRLIDERGMTDVQTYRKANIDRKLFSKIRSNVNYTPSKKTIFCFAIALRLTINETEELLQRAGYALSNCFKLDVVIAYFVENGKYDIFEINEVLFQYDLPILGGL